MNISITGTKSDWLKIIGTIGLLALAIIALMFVVGAALLFSYWALTTPGIDGVKYAILAAVAWWALLKNEKK